MIRKTIGPDENAALYSIGRAWLLGDIATRTEAISRLVDDHGLNKASAGDLLQAFQAMIKGERFTRSVSASTADFLVRQIADDDGLSAAKAALSAIEQHIIYYESVQPSKMHLLRSTVAKLEEWLSGQGVSQDVEATGTSAADAFDIGQHYLAEDVQEIVLSDVPETEKARLIRTRLGQGAFRSNLLKIWRNACAVTGCQINAVLRASHIKPWRDCENNNERLDPDNGLILSANLDTLFDRGLISFSDTGQMLIARNVSELDRKSLGLGKTLTIRPSQRQKLYLRYHREKYGFG